MKTILASARKWAIVPLLLAAIVSGGCTRSPEAKSAKYIAAGKKLLQKKDAARAIIEFLNAAKTTPKNPEAYYELGLAYLSVGDLARGVNNLRKAVELNPKYSAAQLRLAQLMTNANDRAVLEDAQQRLQSLLRDSPANADALNALALTELKLGDPEDAVQNLERAIAAEPSDLVLAATLAQVKSAQGDLAGAEKILKEACEKSPKSADAAVILGRFYSSQDRLSDAEREFDRALSLSKDHTAALLNLATLKYRIGKKGEAEQLFKRLSGESDNKVNADYGIFLFQEGRQDEAIKELGRLAKKDPDDRLARTRLVLAYEAGSRIPDAQKILNDALKKNPRDLEALLQRGELYVSLRQFGEAETDLNKVLHLRADSAEIHYALARFHQARGEAQMQRQELNETLRLNRTLLPARLDLAKSLIADNEGVAALAVLDAAPQEQKRETRVIEQRNWALIIADQAAEARKDVAQALAMARTPELLLQEAILKIREKRFADARQSLHEAMGKKPEDLRMLRVLVGSYAAQGQVPGAVEEVRAFALQHPNSAPIQYFLGSLLIATGDRVKAKQALSAARALDPGFTPAELSLAQINLLQADWKDARQQLGTILTTRGENPLARQWLGMLEVSVGDQAAAMADFRKVIEKQPNNALALNNLAFLLAENGKADEALKYAEKAVELAPDRSEFQGTLGWVLYHKGLYEAAVTHLETAVSKGQDVRQQYYLAAAYFRKGDPVRGNAMLTQARRKNPALPEAKVAEQVAHESTQKR